MTEVMLSYERAWDLACRLVLDCESAGQLVEQPSPDQDENRQA
jgi:hypothetical protein